MARRNRRLIETTETIFRPSVYSTGLQPLQPYTPAWPEGSGYGSLWGIAGTLIEYRRPILVGLSIVTVGGVLLLRRYARRKMWEETG